MMNVYLDAVRDGIIDYENPANQKIASFYCPVDIRVFDGDTLVGQVIDDQIVPDVTTIPILVLEGSKHVLLSGNGDYRFEISATDEGTMDYTIVSADTGASLKSFSGVSLADGKEMSSSVGRGADASDVRLYVLDGNERVAEVTEDGTEIAVGSGADAPAAAENAPAAVPDAAPEVSDSNASSVTISKKTLTFGITAVVSMFVVLLAFLIVVLNKKEKGGK